MMRFALRRAALWCASIFGAALFASSIAALAVPAAQASTPAYLGTILRELPRVLVFDPGPSVIDGMPALSAAGPAILASLDLLFVTALIALLFGALLGAVLSLRVTRPVTSLLLRIASSVPVFCAALLFAGLAGGLMPPDAVPADPAQLRYFVPAVLTIGLAGAGAVALSVSRALAIAGREPYRAGLVRMGLPRGQIFRFYLAPHAFALVLNDLGSIFLALFSAAAVVEWIFAWPGAGAAFIRSVALGDWNVTALLIFVLALARFTLDLIGTFVSRALLEDATP